MINSKAKGSRFERWVAEWFRENLGTPARRGQQFQGTPDSPDVMDAVPGCHIECKAVEKLSIYKALEQAVHDAGPNVPLIIHKANHKPVLVTVQLEHLIELAVRVTMALEMDHGTANGLPSSDGSLGGHRAGEQSLDCYAAGD